MLKRTATRAARKISAHIPGGMAFARRMRRKSITIVMYHGIVEKPLPVYNWCQLLCEEFDRQICYLSHEYQVLPLPELVERIQKGLPVDENALCVTFDDGFQSIRKLAFPILQKYKVPATVFLVTGLIGTTEIPWPEQLYCALSNSTRTEIDVQQSRFSLVSAEDRSSAYRRISTMLKRLPVEQKEELLQKLLRDLTSKAPNDSDAISMLTWQEVEYMHASGLISFGSHTHTHPILSRCSVARQQAELLKSREVLREHFDRADLFAYPNGTESDFSGETKKLLIELGYTCALTAIRGLNAHTSDLYELRRIDNGAGTAFSDLQVGLLGW
jgi:peptidoglycan/xylan/chitin deacetylase (PgdA/CDA1 family)